MSPEQAEAIARELLGDALPRRWAHTQGVGAAARAIAPAFGADAGLLIASAWLHDIGYAPALADSGTGYHPLDGARYLRDVVRARAELSQMVAHHSFAVAGAAELGLAEVLAEEFPAPPDDLADALTCCDMTTGPDGQRVEAAERLAEICARYGQDHPASRTMTKLAPEIASAVERTRTRVSPPVQPAAPDSPET